MWKEAKVFKVPVLVEEMLLELLLKIHPSTTQLALPRWSVFAAGQQYRSWLMAQCIIWLFLEAQLTAGPLFGFWCNLNPQWVFSATPPPPPRLCFCCSTRCGDSKWENKSETEWEEVTRASLYVTQRDSAWSALCRGASGFSAPPQGKGHRMNDCIKMRSQTLHLAHWQLWVIFRKLEFGEVIFAGKKLCAFRVGQQRVKACCHASAFGVSKALAGRTGHKTSATSLI